jgi:hypothetical protein
MYARPLSRGAAAGENSCATVGVTVGVHIVIGVCVAALLFLVAVVLFSILRGGSDDRD